MNLNPGNKDNLPEMKIKIDQIENLARELAQLGRGVPMIEKNCRNIIDTAYVLKFGVSDIAEIESEGGDH